MKNLLLTFDIEEFNVPDDYGIRISQREQCKISAIGLTRVLDLLKKTSTKSTFFTTLIFARNQPALIKRILREGHELALHAYQHNHDYTNMPQDEAYSILKKAKDELETTFHTKIIGFRGPQMRRPSYNVLRKLGIRYDSSLHPTFIPLVAGIVQKAKNFISSNESMKPTYLASYTKNFIKGRKIFEKEGIVVVPLSVSPVVRMPMFWIAFRNLPLLYTKLCSMSALLDVDYLNLYFHPWDFSDLEKDKRLKPIMSLILRNTGIVNLKKLERYILWSKHRGIIPITISQYLYSRAYLSS